jgi:F1F0 ATPase subunit 2
VNPSDLIIPFAGGLLLSGVYFAALWLTVRRLPQARNPLLLLGISFLLRTAVLLGGFYCLMQGRWERLVACLAGFFIVRTVCVIQTRGSLRKTTSGLES